MRPSHHEHVADFELVFLRADVVEAHDLLLDRVNEALRVEHADEFVSSFRCVAGAHKSVQLCPAFFVLLVPVGNRTHHPGDFFACCVEEPRLWDLVVEDGADCLGEVCSHDDFTLDGCTDVVEGCFHDSYDRDVAFDLELVEDVERVLEASSFAHGVVEHIAFLIQALLSPDHINAIFVLLCFIGDDQPVHDLFGRSSRCTTCFLRLHVDHGLDEAIDLDQTTVEVGQGVHLECCRIVRVLDTVEFVEDPVVDALQLLQLRVAECLLLAVFELRLLAVVRPLVHVDFVGVVGLVCEAAVHLFNVVVAVADQDLSVGVEEFVVVVVGDLAAVDDLPDHVFERLVVDFVAG